MWTHITDPEESRDAGGHSNRHSSSTSKANGNGAVASINGNGKSAMANGNKNGNGQHTNGNGNGNEGPASSDEVVAAKPSTQPNSKVNLKPGHPVGLPKELGSHPHLVSCSVQRLRAASALVLGRQLTSKWHSRKTASQCMQTT